MLRTYRTFNLTVGFSNYEFNNLIIYRFFEYGGYKEIL